MTARYTAYPWWVGKIGTCSRCGHGWAILPTDQLRNMPGQSDVRWLDCPGCAEEFANLKVESARVPSIYVKMSDPSILDDERDCDYSVYIMLTLVSIAFFLLGAFVCATLNW